MYGAKMLSFLDTHKAAIGSFVVLKKRNGAEYRGIILEHTDEAAPNVLILKLKSGYNVGVEIREGDTLQLLENKQAPAEETQVHKPVDTSKPAILVLHTGGTIASKVDYRTGGVVTRFSPEEILNLVPGLEEIATIKAQKVFQMWSEDLETIHWKMLADTIVDHVKKGNLKGIIVGIGTDTLEYVASALSFALQGIPIPVMVVGSQRSSDRPSTDASVNLLRAAQFILQSDYAGVAVCMHENESDGNCFIISGHQVKKMHTSRRDTFRPINTKPVARVLSNGTIEYLANYRNGAGKTFEPKTNFSGKVALVKVHPGFRHQQLDWCLKNCEGLVIEGYAFGQLPINEHDEHTKHHPELLAKMKKIAKKMPVVIVSQRPYGLTSMHVYSNSRDLLAAGVIEGKTQAHVALAKLSWALGQTQDKDAVREIMESNVCGEIVDRIENDTFLL